MVSDFDCRATLRGNAAERVNDFDTPPERIQCRRRAVVGLDPENQRPGCRRIGDLALTHLPTPSESECFLRGRKLQIYSNGSSLY